MRAIRNLTALTALGVLSGCLGPGVQEPPAPAGSPTLVVVLVVDQLPESLLERYDSVFTGGLRRLLDQGRVYASATHDHAETETAPGHTTLATGVFPSRHGIVANDWSEERDGEWRSVYSMADPASPILGFPEMPGRSPANMFRGGLPDWLKARSPEARIVSVSRKDRAAIGLAAQAAGEVYWMAPGAGQFVTSTYYHSDYPGWVREFNRREMPRIYADTVWQNVTPPELWSLTRPDTARYELDGVHTFFPHRASDLVDVSDPGAVNTWRYDDTPFPDVAVVEFAKTAIRELELGRRGVVDYLGVSLSQTDLVGHRFGPLSREQLDNLLRVDRLIGELLDDLDETVGPGRWVLAFSSDHGVLGIPEYLEEEGVLAHRLTRDDAVALRSAVQGASVGGLEGERLAESVERAVAALPFVAAAYTTSEIEDADARPDSFAVLFDHSFVEGRAVSVPARYGVEFRYAPNTIAWGEDPATHGSPYYYDRWVPLIFLGGSVEPGTTAEPVATVDVAPTLASLARIEAPDDLNGRVLIDPRP
jgi:predicted AlkP superfamily pyrophosphatase or phosphodiesterase